MSKSPDFSITTQAVSQLPWGCIVGRYEDHLIQELLPAIENQYNVGNSGYCGCIGKSSGGFGAITHGMRHPEIWSAFACHSGGANVQILRYF